MLRALGFISLQVFAAGVAHMMVCWEKEMCQHIFVSYSVQVTPGPDSATQKMGAASYSETNA